MRHGADCRGGRGRANIRDRAHRGRSAAPSHQRGRCRHILGGLRDPIPLRHGGLHEQWLAFEDDVIEREGLEDRLRVVEFDVADSFRPLRARVADQPDVAHLARLGEELKDLKVVGARVEALHQDREVVTQRLDALALDRIDRWRSSRSVAAHIQLTMVAAPAAAAATAVAISVTVTIPAIAVGVMLTLAAIAVALTITIPAAVTLVVIAPVPTPFALRRLRLGRFLLEQSFDVGH